MRAPPPDSSPETNATQWRKRRPAPDIARDRAWVERLFSDASVLAGEDLDYPLLVQILGAQERTLQRWISGQQKLPTTAARLVLAYALILAQDNGPDLEQELQALFTQWGV